MFLVMRRALLSFAVVCVLGSAGVAGDFPYANHDESWFPQKFMELLTDTKHRFQVVRKEIGISPPDDSWKAKLAISFLYRPGADYRKVPPYMVVLRALTPMPADAVPALVRYMASKNYAPGTALAWIRWDVSDGMTEWVLVGPPDAFINENIFKLPPMETEET